MNGGRETSSGAAALSALLPEKAEGYAPAGPDRHFTADTLFDLIDGGAEIYRAFNVQRTVHRRYTHAEANDIIADIFDMGSAADACGAYHNDIREGENPGIGRESEYQGGSLSFWKDRYYVSVVAIHESAASARAVRAIGAAVAEAIPGDAAPPALAGLLPEEGLLVEARRRGPRPCPAGQPAPARALRFGRTRGRSRTRFPHGTEFRVAG